jgi:hypothetical protein
MVNDELGRIFIAPGDRCYIRQLEAPPTGQNRSALNLLKTIQCAIESYVYLLMIGIDGTGRRNDVLFYKSVEDILRPYA